MKNAPRVRCHSAFGLRIAFVISHSLLPLIQILGSLSSIRHCLDSRDSRAQAHQAPLLDLSASAALMAARTPSGVLSFGSTGWLLMKRVGVTFIPRDSPR